MPHRAPIIPARRFVTTPASSYILNMMAVCQALNPRAYACSRTIILQGSRHRRTEGHYWVLLSALLRAQCRAVMCYNV